MRRPLADALRVAACAVGCALGCSGPPSARISTQPPTPIVHVVQPGETIYRLSRTYGVSVQDIVRVNGIADVSDVPIGARLMIPGAGPAVSGAGFMPASIRPPGFADLRALALREASLDFGWPIEGRVSSGFGSRGRHPHHGIDIPARPGTPIRAAEAGRVIRSGWLGDYGRVVIVKHAGRYSTVYAHNRSNLVREGAFVDKGQVIADVGSSGNASGHHLHFEIRRERTSQDPLRYLP